MRGALDARVPARPSPAVVHSADLQFGIVVGEVPFQGEDVWAHESKSPLSRGEGAVFFGG